MLTGLLSSLLSGMEEPDEGIQKMIMELMNQINQSVGDKFYLSTLWYILLKNSKNRIATFKILFKKFSELDPKNANMITQRIIENSEPRLQEICEYIQRTDGKFESFYPNLWMIVNALIKCLEDQDIGIRKNCLDFMIKHIDMRSDRLLDETKRIQVFESVIKLLDTNDFSMLKRIFKLLFNANDVDKPIEQTQSNITTLSLLARAFSNILNKSPSNEAGFQLPFKIIEVLNHNNPALLGEFLNRSAYEFTNYLHKWGFEQPCDANRYIVEQTRNFVSTCHKFLESYLFAFESFVKSKVITSHDLSLMEFIIKIIISNSNITMPAKFKFTLALMDAAFAQLDQHFERSLTGSNNIWISTVEENHSTKMKQFDRIMLLLPECTIILNDMLKNSGVTLDDDLRVRIGDLINKDSALLEKLLSSTTPDPIIIENYSKIFTVLMKIDALQKFNKPISTKDLSVSFEDLPYWLKCQFNLLNSEFEYISYSALKFLFSLFEFESQYTTIQEYNQIIYGQKRNYEINGACWIIMSKIVDLVEIHDFKKLSLNFLFKFFRFNLGFVSRYLLNLLRQRSAEDFKRVSLLWHATSHYTNSDCRLVLQDTVFEMLAFVEIKDPIIKNYFKNWLTQSQDNFIIILDAVLKDIIKYTNWNFNEQKQIVYKVPFDCDKFALSLNYLSTIFNYSTSNFVHYIQNFTITSEFEFYDNEMNILLSQYFEERESKKYLYFILKIFLRYLIGRLDEFATTDVNEITKHNEKVLGVKESIVQLLEKFIMSLNDIKIVAQISIPLIRIMSRLLERALKEDKMILQLSYLNFLQFLLFRTNIISSEDIKGVLSGLLLDPQFLSTYLLGLANDRHFVIREFIDFGAQLNFLLAKYLKHPQLTQFVQNLIVAYLENINKRYSYVRNLKEEEQMKESMTALLKGLKMCLEFFLQVNEIEEKISSGNVEKAFITIFTLGIVQTKDEIRKKISFLKDENTCKHIIGMFEKIFDRLCTCWKIVGVISEQNIFDRFRAKISLIEEKKNSDLIGINKRILAIVRPLSVNFLDRTVEAFVQNWIQNNEQVNLAKIDGDTTLNNLKILEVIYLLEISPIRFLFSLLNGKQLKNIIQLKRYDGTKNKKEFLLIKDTQSYESNFLSFLFSYLKYTPNTDNINFEVYGIILKMLKCFENSITPPTLCWIIDILNLMVDKFPIELNKYHTLKNEWLTFLIDLLTKSLRLILKDQIIIYKDTSRDYSMIFPLNPSIQEFNSGFYSKNQIYDIIRSFQNFTDNSHIELRHRFFLTVSIQQNIVKFAETFFIDTKSGLFSASKVLKNRNTIEKIVVQKLSEIIFDLSQLNNSFLKEFKREIIEVFESDDFFKCNIDTLKIWSRLIDRFLDSTHIDILSEHFETLTKILKISSGLKVSKEFASSYTQGWLISEPEKYINRDKLKILLEKIKNVLKEDKVHPNLIILILFSLRILILRLKRETLNGMFKTMWPAILFLLDKLIKSNAQGNQEIILAALKLLEIISCTDIDEFNLHKWAFFFEHYSIDIQLNSKGPTEQPHTPYRIRPLLLNKLSKGTQVNYTSEQLKDIYTGNVRRILIEENKMEESNLEKKIYEFLTYLILLSNTDIALDREELESLIQGDFIDFSNFINL